MTEYVTVAEYLALYGVQETATLTNEARATPGSAPVVDEVKVEEALADASDVVDGYVSTRYALPLATTPRLVKGWVKTLAREILYRTRPTAAVTEAAERARSQLRDLATRKLDLPVTDGAPPAAESGGQPASTSRDAPPDTFSGYAMGRYMQPFTGGYEVAAWKRGGR